MFLKVILDSLHTSANLAQKPGSSGKPDVPSSFPVPLARTWLPETKTCEVALAPLKPVVRGSISRVSGGDIEMVLLKRSKICL